MKRLLKVLGLVLTLVFTATATPASLQAASPSGDLPNNRIQLAQNMKKSCVFTKDYNAKYFTVTVQDTGVLKISYSSKQMKKPVDIKFDYNDGQNTADIKTIKYNKKKKQASGTLAASYIVKPGTYAINVSTTDVVGKDTKFTIQTSLTPKKYVDKEPNDNIETAQKITVGTKATSYNMYLANTVYASDMVDYFTFKVKKGKKLTVKLETKNSSDLRIIIKRKSGKTEEIINADSDEQYTKKTGKKYTFSYTSGKLEADDYYVMVWLQDGGAKEQVEYNISFAAK